MYSGGEFGGVVGCEEVNFVEEKLITTNNNNINICINRQKFR
jgi:hypothetical protein